MANSRNVHDNPLKDAQGRYRTNSLFYEYKVAGMTPIWTIFDKDRKVGNKTYPSLKRIYMSYNHVPEYEYDFAMNIFGDWDHWDRLSNHSSLKEVFARWREELDVRLKADAIREIIKVSQSESSSASQAARYIAEKGYISKRGRPSKAEIEREKKIEAGVESELKEDFERINTRGLEELH